MRDSERAIDRDSERHIYICRARCSERDSERDIGTSHERDGVCARGMSCCGVGVVRGLCRYIMGHPMGLAGWRWCDVGVRG